MEPDNQRVRQCRPKTKTEKNTKRVIEYQRQGLPMARLLLPTPYSKHHSIYMYLKKVGASRKNNLIALTKNHRNTLAALLEDKHFKICFFAPQKNNYF